MASKSVLLSKLRKLGVDTRRVKDQSEQQLQATLTKYERQSRQADITTQKNVRQIIKDIGGPQALQLASRIDDPQLRRELIREAKQQAKEAEVLQRKMSAEETKARLQAEARVKRALFENKDISQADLSLLDVKMQEDVLKQIELNRQAAIEAQQKRARQAQQDIASIIAQKEREAEQLRSQGLQAKVVTEEKDGQTSIRLDVGAIPQGSQIIRTDKGLELATVVAPRMFESGKETFVSRAAQSAARAEEQEKRFLTTGELSFRGAVSGKERTFGIGEGAASGLFKISEAGRMAREAIDLGTPQAGDITSQMIPIP